MSDREGFVEGLKNTKPSQQQKYEDMVLSRQEGTITDLKLQIFYQYCDAKTIPIDLQSKQLESEFSAFNNRLKELMKPNIKDAPSSIKELGDFSVKEYDNNQRIAYLQRVFQEGNIASKLEEMDRGVAFVEFCEQRNINYIYAKPDVHAEFDAMIEKGEITIEQLLEAAENRADEGILF